MIAEQPSRGVTTQPRSVSRSSYLRTSVPRWGYLRTSVPRFGITRHHLVLLAPGSTTTDRRRLSIRAAAPALATGSALVAFVSGARVADPLAGLGFAIGAFAVVIFGIRRTTSNPGLRFRQIDVVVGLGREPLPSREVYQRVLTAAADMEEASAALRCDEISGVEFELRWERAWASLPHQEAPASDHRA